MEKRNGSPPRTNIVSCVRDKCPNCGKEFVIMIKKRNCDDCLTIERLEVRCVCTCKKELYYNKFCFYFIGNCSKSSNEDE